MTEADQEAGSRRGAGPGNRSRTETEKKYNHKAGSSTEKKGALFELIDRVGLQLGLQSLGSRINSNNMVRILLAQRNFKDFCRNPSGEPQKSFFFGADGCLRHLFSLWDFFYGIDLRARIQPDHLSLSLRASSILPRAITIATTMASCRGW